MNAVCDAQLALGAGWVRADDIPALLPNMDRAVLQATLESAKEDALLLFDGSSYAVRTVLNRSEQRAYSETLEACQRLGRPVALSEIGTADRKDLSRQMSRLVFKGYLRETNGRYTPTRQAHATLTMPLAAAKRPRKKTVAKARVRANQEAALVVTAQQDSPSLSARVRALAAALLALFVRP